MTVYVWRQTGVLEMDMGLLDVLRSAQGGAAMDNLARAFGLTPQQAAAVVSAVMPKLSEYVERNTLSRGGLADIIGAVGHGHHEAYVDDPRMISDPTAREDGNAILGHIVGSKDRSRAIANQAEASSGVAAEVIRSMLPVLAGMFMGGLSKQVKEGLGDIAGRLPPGGAPGLDGGGVFLPRRGAEAQTGGRDTDSGGVRSTPGGGLEMPDGLPDYSDPGRGQRRGGAGGGAGGGNPLPLPGNRVPGVPGNADNPFGDLAEIIRKGLGLPGGNGPVVIQLPGGSSFPWPGGDEGGAGGQSGRRPAPADNDDGNGFPWPQNDRQPRGQTRQPRGQGGGLPMPDNDGSGGGFPWPRGGEQGGQGNPLPLPGGGSGGGGGGGRRIEVPSTPVGGSMLWTIIRSILGSALGFQSSGLMSWLIRMVFMKYGWQILRTILGRGLLGGGR